MILGSSEHQRVPDPSIRIDKWHAAESKVAIPPRTITFPHNDGYLASTEAGIKLGTLHRYSERYLFEPGEAFQLHCDAEGPALDCRVIGIQIAAMQEIDPVLLAVDGFLNYQSAFDRMCVFYNRPETPFTADTKMVYVTFMAQALFDCLNPSKCLTLMVNEPQVSFRHVDMRPIVFRSIAYWHALQGGNALQYLTWLLTHDLISTDEFRGVVDSMKGGKISAETKLERLHSEKLLEVLRDPHSRVYPKLIELDY